MMIGAHEQHQAVGRAEVGDLNAGLRAAKLTWDMVSKDKERPRWSITIAARKLTHSLSQPARAEPPGAA
jgi:hypothetical protein